MIQRVSQKNSGHSKPQHSLDSSSSKSRDAHANCNRGAENRTRTTCSQSTRTTTIRLPEKTNLLALRKSHVITQILKDINPSSSCPLCLIGSPPELVQRDDIEPSESAHSLRSLLHLFGILYHLCVPPYTTRLFWRLSGACSCAQALLVGSPFHVKSQASYHVRLPSLQQTEQHRL